MDNTDEFSSMTTAQARKYNREAEARKRRNVERRIARQEEAYVLLETKRYLDQAHTAMEVLSQGWEADERAPNERLPLTRERVASIGKAADIALQLLRKTLPDLKAVELNDLREHQHLETDVKELTTQELVAVILEQRRKTLAPAIQDAQYTEVPAPNTTPVSVQPPPWEER